MNEKGFSMIEALAAFLLVGLVATGIMSAYSTLIQANSRNEIWAAAVVAAEETIEAHRLDDPSAMPTTGSTAPQTVTVGMHDFAVVTTYCAVPSLCTDNARQLVIDVSYENKEIYDIETVFTKIR